MYLICDLLGIVFFFNLEPRVISAHFQRCRNDPGLEITNLFVFFLVKKSQCPSRLSYNSLLNRSIVNPCMGQSLIAIYFGEPLIKIKKKKKGKKKNKNRDSSNRHRFLSLPTRRQQTSNMGLLRRRLIFAKDFDMNKFSTDKIWPVSTLEDTRCISTSPKSFCLPLGYILVMCYITYRYPSTFWQPRHFMHWDSGFLSQLLVRDSAFTSENPWSAPWGE